jgi:ATP-binding protein involved in chromosome partitioning
MKTYRDISGDGGSDIAGQAARRAARMRERMASIANSLVVMSGKGGVGKSAVTVNLAAAFALQGRKVGVLDADINGPCMARMLGVERQTLMLGEDGVIPTEGPLGMKVVSMDLLLAHETAPVEWNAPAPPQPHLWRGALEAAAVQEFFTDTVWGKLDYLLVDLPPGPERFPGLHSLLPRCDGAIAVTIPSGVAQLTVGRSVAAARSLKVKLLGVVENMSSYLCPCCGTHQPLFRDAGDAGGQVLGASILGRIPFDPRIARCCDQGVPFVLAHRQTPAGRAFLDIAAQVSRLRVAQGGGQ